MLKNVAALRFSLFDFLKKPFIICIKFNTAKKSPTAYAVGDFFAADKGFERAAPVRTLVQKLRAGEGFRPWENPLVSGRSPCGCGRKPLWDEERFVGTGILIQSNASFFIFIK
ncbi:MAG: hypothetical protein IJN53_02215 [Oscillospiraceae bacterium]|nr:hypothetical protein [Oscillospiraceae bacterium]